LGIEASQDGYTYIEGYTAFVHAVIQYAQV